MQFQLQSPLCHHDPNPIDDLGCAQDGEAAEEAQGAANVGDHVDDGHGGSQDHAKCRLLVDVHRDQAHIVHVAAMASV